MNFISVTFLIFVGITFCLYYIVPYKMQWIVLLLASLLFYMLFDMKSVFFLLISTATVFLTAIYIYKCSRFRKGAVTLGIAVNIFFLVAFKYASFMEGMMYGGNIFAKFRECVTERFSLIIPLGISFYTLALLGYLIDVYRHNYAPEKNFFKFLLFSSFFPHILQGPIARYDQLSGQFLEKHRLVYDRTMYALQLMVWGYFKKMIIADRASIFVDTVYSSYGIVGGTELLIASIFYTIQIYADFSGCMDLASGVANLFGIELIQNFRQPYLSRTIKEFWRRWHISLSSWYRDYLYIPIGGDCPKTMN